MNKPETSGEIIIRRAGRKDFSRVFELIAESFPKEIDLVGFDPQRLRRLARLYSIASLFFPILDFLRIDFETILVASANGKVVGEIHLVPHGKRIWSLDSSAVDKKFRGRGIYRRLMQQSLTYISQRHGERIVTSLWTSNVPAVKITNELRFRIFEETTLLNLIETDLKPRMEVKESLEIREVKKSDADQIFSICRAIDAKRMKVFKIAPKEFLSTSSTNLRNTIAGIHSHQWVLSDKGKIVGHAKITYTSPKESGNIESFYVLSLDPSLELAGYLLQYILTFLAGRNIRRVVTTLNKEWKEITETFERFGFTPVASVYEMVKWLNSQSS